MLFLSITISVFLLQNSNQILFKSTNTRLSPHPIKV
jgi:hypothetical protein